MKKLFTLLTALLCVGVSTLWAEDCPVLNEPDEISYTAGGLIAASTTTGTFTQGGYLSFESKKARIGSGDVAVQQLLNGTWTTITTISQETKYTSYGPYKLDRNATQIRFYSSSGSLKKYFRNIYVTQAIYVDAPADNTLNFGDRVIGSANSQLSTTIQWRNTSALNLYLGGENPAQFEASISGNAETCTNGTATISVTYKHNLVGTHTATLTVSNGTYSYDIALSGTTEKKDQQILWAADYTNEQITLPVGKEVLNAATATSGYAVTYSSSDERILAITNDGTAFKALAAGTATLTATQAGDANEWNAVSETKTVVITEKKVQNIAWTDNLSRLKVGGEAVTLSAVVRILTIEGDNEVYTEAPERTALLTYTSGNNNVVSVKGKVLTIIGEGETTLTATVPGDDNYEGTSVSMPVRVRAASALCEAYVLDDDAERTLNTIDNTTYSITGPAAQLTFTANRTAILGFSGGNLKADVYYDGGWHNIFDESVPQDSYRTYGPYNLPRNTTQVKFYTETGATGYKHIKDVSVTTAHYLETTTPSIVVEKSIIGDVVRGEVKIQYSNLPDDLPITLKNNNITLSQETLDNLCGEYGEKVITFTATPTAVGTLEDEITISDEITGLSLSIPVTIHTQRNTQTINWEDNLTDILTTDNITLTATAETAITYSTSNANIAYVEGGKLVIVRDGDVTITANAAQDDKFEAATLSKDIHIALTPSEITELPTVADITYGTAFQNDMLVGGSANVAGHFEWAIADGADYRPGTQAVPVVFIPENTNWYAATNTTVEVNILKMDQSIEWNNAFENIRISDTIYLAASAQTAVSYSLGEADGTIAILEGNKLYFLTIGKITLTAVAEESELYNAASATRTISISRAQAEIISAPTVEGTLTYGQAMSEAVLIGGEANCAGHFEWADPEQQQVVGSYWMTVNFIPENAEAFENTVCSVLVEIVAAQQEIIWNFDKTILTVGESIVLDATATSGYSVTYELSPTNIASLDTATNTLTGQAEGSLTITAYQDGMDEDGNKNYLVAEPVSFTITISTGTTTTTDAAYDQSRTSKVRKVLRNGQIYLLRGDELFTLQGNKVQ